MRLSQRIRRTLVFWLANISYRLFNIMPRPLAVFLGGWIGLAAWKVITKDQRLIFRHLSLCYNGTLSAVEKVNIGQRFFINSGRNIADLVRFEKYFEREVAASIEIEGLEYFDLAYKKGRGVFGVTAHLGNYELLAVALSKLGYKIGVISRPLADRKLNELLVKTRQKLGLVNFYASEYPLGVVRWLKSGGAVGVLIDTDSERAKGDFVPFYDRLTKIPVGQSIIAARMSVPLVPMACVRAGFDSYKVIIRPEIPINICSDPEKEVHRVTRACSRELEVLIQQYPDQWIWMHNRWRSSPGEIRT